MNIPLARAIATDETVSLRFHLRHVLSLQPLTAQACSSVSPHEMSSKMPDNRFRLAFVGRPSPGLGARLRGFLRFRFSLVWQEASGADSGAFVGSAALMTLGIVLLLCTVILPALAHA
jgi:hypothetical protein